MKQTIYRMERKDLFLHWVKRDELKPEKILPAPLNQLIWAAFPLKKAPWVLLVATPRTTRLDKSSEGVTMAFHQELLLLSEKVAEDEPVFLIIKEGTEVRLTYGIGMDPYLTRSFSVQKQSLSAKIQETIHYLKQVERWNGVKKVFLSGSDEDQQALKKTLSAPIFLFHLNKGTNEDRPHPKTRWLRAPSTWKTRLRDEWAKNKEKAMAVLVLVFVVSGFGLSQQTEKNKKEIRRHKRTLIQQQAAQAQQARQSKTTTTPDSVLTSLLNELPPRIYLTDVQYSPLKKRVTVRGRTRSYENVSKIKSHLSSQKWVRSIQNEKSNANSIQGRTWIDFSLEATLL